jgi:hypothetical protein
MRPDRLDSPLSRRDLEQWEIEVIDRDDGPLDGIAADARTVLPV